MATRRSIKAINWSGISERLHEHERAAYAALKGKSDLYMRKTMQFPEKSPSIDWAYYQKNVQIAGMVDTFKKQYESLSIPYPVDKYTEQIELQAKPIYGEVKQFIAETDETIKECANKIAKIQALIPFNEMTMEDFYDMYPENCLNTFVKPTIWPHQEEDQIDNPEEEH